MANTYEDFLEVVPKENIELVRTLHDEFMKNGCKVEIKEAKQGYLVSYSYMKEKKKIALMNYVFRKSGMMSRIYARHISNYQGLLDSLPDTMKKSIMKAGDCKRLNGISECSPTCTAGYDFVMDKVNYKKCKNNAFFWLVNDESQEHIQKIVESELEMCFIE